MLALEDYIRSKINIDHDHLKEIVRSFTSKSLKKDQSLIRKGQFVNKYYFIATGGVRIVINTPEREITAWMIFENNMFTDLQSLRSGNPTEANIVTVAETTVYSIDALKMEEYYKRFPEWQSFGRLIVEDAFLNVIDSLVSFQTMDAETRYLELLKKSDVINRIPLKQLASYLGVTPNSLSRIRKNIP